jgi:hypothetical protein
MHLNLGIVNDMARVRLNGKDLGVVWCAPGRVEISEALKTGKINSKSRSPTVGRTA